MWLPSWLWCCWPLCRLAPTRRTGLRLLTVQLREDQEAFQPRLHDGCFRTVFVAAGDELPGPAVGVHGAYDAGTSSTETCEHEHRRGFHLEVQDALTGHLVGEVRVTDGKLRIGRPCAPKNPGAVAVIPT